MKDFWVGLIVLGFAALYWFEAGKIRISPLDGPVGAAGLPKSLAMALGLLAILLMAQTVLKRVRLGAEAAQATDEGAGHSAWHPHLRAIGMLGLGLAYLLVLPYLGYTISIAVLLMAISLYIGIGLSWRSVAFALLGAALFRLMFVEFLGIPLPDGQIIEALLGRN